MSETLVPAPEIQEALEPVPCPLCGATPFRPRRRIMGYAIVDYPRCGLTHVNPRPTDADLARFYETVFHTAGWYGRFPHLRDFDYFGRAAGCEAFGVDPNPPAVEAVRQLLGPDRVFEGILEAGWDYGAAGSAGRRGGRRGRGLARLVSLLGGRCELIAQRLKGRLLGKHDIVCHPRKPREGGGGRG